MADSIEIPDIKLRSCKPDLVRADLTRLGLDTSGSTKAIVHRLAEYYAINKHRIDIADCTSCKGDSDCDLPVCPFCGDAVFEKPEAPAAAPTKKKGGSSKKVAAKKKVPKKAVAKKNASKKPAVAKKKNASKKPAVAKKKKASKKKTVTAKKKTPTRKGKPPKDAPAPDPSTALVKDPNAFDIAQRLGEQEGIIRNSMTTAGLAMYELGTALQVISDDQLWKSITEDGIPKFRGFKQYIGDVLGISPSHAYRAMGVAKELDIDTIRELSGRQATLLLEKGTKVTKPDDKGANTTQRSDAANSLTGRDRTPPPPPKDAITVAMAMGMTKRPLYRRPTKGNAKVADPENADPANAISQKPWAEMSLDNDVRLIARLDTDRKGDWVISFEFRKGETIL